MVLPSLLYENNDQNLVNKYMWFFFFFYQFNFQQFLAILGGNKG